MTPQFGLVDWAIVVAYLVALTAVGGYLGRRQSLDARDFFLASGSVPPSLAAVSVLATTQSAATFLGAPDAGYRSDYTYLSTTLGALLAAFVVARVFMPRFYALGVTTVYELLGARFDARAMRAAGAMFLVGRILAGGSRLYLAAIAVSMIMFLDVSPQGILVASLALVLVSFLFTVHGGLRSIVWLDLLQFVIYVGAAVVVLLFLLHRIPVPLSTMIGALAATPDGQDKLRLLNVSLSLKEPFGLAAVMTGGLLLSIGNFALDQDTTQRLLACKDARSGSRGLYGSVLASVPVVFVFLTIGALLYIFYRRPDLMGAGALQGPTGKFRGEDVTVLMHFILTEVPTGLRGLVTVGVIATAVGTTMSALNAMSSVLIQDFYRPWRSAKGRRDETHYVFAGRVGMALMGLMFLVMAVASYFWQHFTNAPLLEFVLSVMNFAYAGLLGVYFAAVFTRRGSSTSVIAALATGFVVILALQPGVATALQLPTALRGLAFPWQLCVGTFASFLTCLTGRSGEAARASAFRHKGPARPLQES